MSKPPKSVKIVEPVDDASPERDAIDVFISHGWTPADSLWLGPLCLKAVAVWTGGKPVRQDIVLEWLKRVALGRPDRTPAKARDACLLRLYVQLCGVGETPWVFRDDQTRPGIDQCRAWASEFLTDRPGMPKVSFERGLVEHGWPGDCGDRRDLAGEASLSLKGSHPTSVWNHGLGRLTHLLIEGARIDLSQVLNIGELARQGKRREAGWPDVNIPDLTLPNHIAPWLFGLGSIALERAFPVVQTSYVPDRPAVAQGLMNTVYQWCSTKFGHHARFNHAGTEFHRQAKQYLDLFRGWDQASTSPALRQALVEWGIATVNSSPTENKPSEDKEYLLGLASAEIASIRKLLSAGQAAKEEFGALHFHVHNCATALFRYGGVWKGMKPLLLAMRAMAVPAVANDLRYWEESGLPTPPRPWCIIPETLATMFHGHVRHEQAKDANLESLRSEVATFCLGRLVDRWKPSERQEAARSGRLRTNDDMMERHPAWRYCLIRAVSSLGVNPGGKGHHALHTSSQIDPDADVRAAAKDTYEQMRRGVGLPEGTSPRRAIMSAFWWIRQAHLLGLEIQPDPNGAQRTRRKELTRTQEREQGDNPAR